MTTQTIETTEITSSADIIDVRDVIARVEALEATLPPSDESDGLDNDERLELATLIALLDDLRGNGGDEQYQGDWYPITLIADSYFADYAQELAEECGDLDREMRWPFTCIDWEKAARELQMDYTTTDFDGETFWYR